MFLLNRDLLYKTSWIRRKKSEMSKELANGDMTTISAERGSVRWREITSEIPLGLGTNLVK